MVRFSVSAELGMPAHLFFVERDSAAFRSLVAKVMKLGALDIAEGWMEGDVEVYKFVTDPDMDKYVPRSLQHHLAGGKITYTDIIRYDPKLISSAPYKLPVESIPPVFSNRANIQCTLLIEEIDEQRCRQTLEGEVKLNIFGLGAIAERIIADSLKKVYSGIPPIVERWKAFREEILRQPNGHEVLVKGRPDNQGVDWISDQIRDLLKAEVGPRLQTEASTMDISHMPSPEVTPPQQPTDAEIHRPTTTHQPESVYTAIDQGQHQEGRQQAQPQVQQQAARQSQPADVRGQPSTAGHDRSLAAEHHHDPGHNMHVQTEGEDTFFDAEEDWQWADEMPSWGDDPATKDAVRSDHEEALSWYRTFRQKGGSVESLSVDDTDSTESELPPQEQSPPPHIHRESLRPESRRFSQSYRQDFDSWTNFWDKHQVPEQDVPDVRARLGHLVSLAGSWGMLKPRKARKQHRRTRSGGSGGKFFSQLSGHHRRSSSGVTEMSVPVSGSQGSPSHLPSQSSGSGHLQQDMPLQQRAHVDAAAPNTSVIQGDNHATAERKRCDSGSLMPAGSQEAPSSEGSSHGHKHGGRTRQAFKKIFSRNNKSFGSSGEAPDVAPEDGHLQRQ